jgi:hypothetical protein
MRDSHEIHAKDVKECTFWKLVSISGLRLAPSSGSTRVRSPLSLFRLRMQVDRASKSCSFLSLK